LISAVKFTGQVYDQLYWIGLQPSLQVKFLGPIYEIIVGVLITRHVHDQVYWIGFRAEFIG